MAVSQKIARDVSRNLPTVGGGVVGVGAPFALREFADVQNGQEFSLLGDPGSTIHRLTRPSVAWGLGMGALTGALYMASAGPRDLQDFYLTHSITAIPTGLASAALPVEAGGGGGQTQSMRRASRSRSRSASSNGSSGEFAASGGQSAETQPVN